MPGPSPTKSDRLRLFVAAYPPREWVRDLRRAVATLDLPEHRPTPDDQVHLTLHFIGPAERRELDAIRESVERSCAGLSSFELTPLRFIGLPPRAPGLLAVETDLPPVLAELHTRLVRRLARKPAGKPYVPHITACRFVQPRRGELDPVTAELPPFRVETVDLMQSKLQPTGAEHWLVGRGRLSA